MVIFKLLSMHQQKLTANYVNCKQYIERVYRMVNPFSTIVIPLVRQKGLSMELLAPAGTMENFIAALESGADAIYLGGKGFNARAHAANFGIEELAEAIRLAHILDVSVYVTVNTPREPLIRNHL